MRAVDLIRSRRSVRAFEARPLADGALWACLEAARWAPCEGLRQPWRLAILGPASRAQAARCLAASEARRGVAPGLRAAPALAGCAEAVAVVQTAAPDDATGRSDRLAIGAVVQNLLLSAWDEGFAGLWIGGAAAEDPGLRAAVGAAAGEFVAAVVALGYPESVPPRPPRRNVAEFTQRLP